MAQTLGGQPRFGFGVARRAGPSVPKPPSFVDTDYFSPFRDPLDFLPEARAQDAMLRAKGRNAPSVYIDPKVPLVSQAELARRREAIDRAFFMADNPLAGTAYGLATAFGASPGWRDVALAAGGTLDAAMQGAAPRGAPLRPRPSPPRATPAPPPFGLPPIRYRELNSSGDAQGINAILAAPLVPTRKKVPRRLRPPGLQPPETEFWEARGHLAADQLGGAWDDPRNFMALTQTPANSPWMRDFENLVAKRVRNGEVVDYSVTPYGAAGLPPELILMTASSLGRNPAARLVANPARRRR